MIWEIAKYRVGERQKLSGSYYSVGPKDSRFACPCGPECDTAFTSYVVLVGDKTLFPGFRSTSLSEIPKNQDPILVVEITQSNTRWTEPRDLLLDLIEPQSGSNFIKLSRSHEATFRYITASGKIGILPADTNADVIRRLAEFSRN